MNRSRLLATAALSAGLATAGFGLAAPSVALAGAPQTVGGFLAAPDLPHGPVAVATPSTPPSPKGPGTVVRPPVVDPTLGLDDVVQPPKPPKPMPPVATVPPVVVNPDPTKPPTTPPTGPDDVTGEPPCPTHGPCGDTPEPSESPDPSGTPDTPDGSGATGGGLPVTGASVGVFAGLGLLLLAGGALLLALARRSRVSPR